MNEKMLKSVLKKHDKWLAGLRGGVRADLRGADLSGAKLNKAVLSDIDMSGSDLRDADLTNADMTWTELCSADLLGANLRGANLIRANLSGCTGLLDDVQWMMDNLETTSNGWVVYKRFGNTEYAQPEYWDIHPGSIISEVCNPCRTSDCACGINVGTLEWCRKNYKSAELWKCLIRWEWGPGIVVPYHTDGKFRCSRLELVEKMKDGNDS